MSDTLIHPILPVPGERCCGEAMVHHYRETPRGSIAEYVCPVCQRRKLNTTEALMMLRADEDAELDRLCRAAGIGRECCDASDLPMLRREVAAMEATARDEKAAREAALASGACLCCGGSGQEWLNDGLDTCCACGGTGLRKEAGND